ncbi:NineTeen Complex (NTC) component [Didymella heteroderae]|uniref:NineTeen Complex (NTC) component n=1 Tax=Didymella heteroderae TaxID=1769908 RepID=A0A9P5BXL8_9PLEO|nr:NineTeen Complex (NTC) component [Didymella heteroderae]
MARNSEKAHSMLFRFRAAQAAEAGIIDISRTRRPKLITSVTSIPVCEKWRGQVLKEISRKVTKIQDEALSDYQIRDLNDEINKAMREKYMWEKQIRDLGGPNYMRGGRVLDEEGREVPGGGKGYRQERPEDDDGARKGGEKRSELRQKVDAGYYGYNLDEEDGTLLAYEAKKEKEAWDHFMTLPDDLSEKPGKVQKEWIELPGDAGDGVRWQVPTLEEVNNELVERRRRKLLEKLG